ncbi:hypothetical protein HNP46_000500 [Pseudomonas nitritireducens]|uniref:Uncharacterized protein n=1 Tax=Pseudomonas nitroreducens TaxID=46680 RepID=A0A7W7KF76_PSENT|nr:hypothetical protein [Pseudomonas nitritireducens]MBB4861689.1 hypothetical protein [Pseudomonas nitritireducens]
MYEDEMDQEAKELELLEKIASAKLDELREVPKGAQFGRRLELGATSNVDIEQAIKAQLVDIGRRMGPDFLINTPAVALEQFSIQAIVRDEDTAGLLKSLVNSFMLAYLTPETTERAVAHLQGLEALRLEVAKTRQARHGEGPSVH